MDQDRKVVAGVIQLQRKAISACKKIKSKCFCAFAPSATHAARPPVPATHPASQVQKQFHRRQVQMSTGKGMSDDSSKQPETSDGSAAKSSRPDAGKIKRFFLSRFKSKDPNPDPSSASGIQRRRTSSVGNEEENLVKKKSMSKYPGIESEPKSAPNL